MQHAVAHVVDEARDVFLVGEEGREQESVDRLTHVVVRVGERLDRPRWRDAEFGGELGTEAGLIYLLEPAVGVVDEDNLARPERPL